jgi:hypothetical protein
MRHQRERVATAENSIKIEAEPGADQIEKEIDGLLGLLQAGLKGWRVHVRQLFEEGLPGQDCRDTAKEQVARWTEPRR